MTRVKWREHLKELAAWILYSAVLWREKELAMRILSLGRCQEKHGASWWRVKVIEIRDSLQDIPDKTATEEWAMNKLWLIALAEAKNSGVKEEDIWK